MPDAFAHVAFLARLFAPRNPERFYFWLGADAERV
jgi:hypothetical protein